MVHKLMRTTDSAQPQLGRPGAGLPLVELLVAKYLIFPHRFRTTTPAQAIDQFQQESNSILGLARSGPAELLGERRLVPRLRGLEDSSRYWSVAMTLQHLVMVGEGMRQIVFSLSQEKTAPTQTRIEDVKPSVEVEVSGSIDKFETMTAKFIKTVEAIDFSTDTKVKHTHPWFGPLNARQWLLFAAPHEAIHRRQIEEIIARLKD